MSRDLIAFILALVALVGMIVALCIDAVPYEVAVPVIAGLAALLAPSPVANGINSLRSGGSQ